MLRRDVSVALKLLFVLSGSFSVLSTLGDQLRVWLCPNVASIRDPEQSPQQDPHQEQLLFQFKAAGENFVANESFVGNVATINPGDKCCHTKRKPWLCVSHLEGNFGNVFPVKFLHSANTLIMAIVETSGEISLDSLIKEHDFFCGIL